MVDQATAEETEVSAVTDVEPGNTDTDQVTVDADADDEAMGAAFDKAMGTVEETKDGEKPETDVKAALDKDGVKPETKVGEKAEDGKKASDDTKAEEKGKEALSDTPEPPAHLPYDIKANWKDIPPAARDGLANLLAEQDRKFGELGGELRDLRPFKEVTEEFKEYFDGTAGNYKPVEAVKYLFGLQRDMDRDPTATIMKIAETYGIASNLLNPTDATRQIASLTQTVRDLTAKLEGQANPENVRDIVKSTMQEDADQKAIEDFSKTSDFYKDVEAELPKYIQMAWIKLGDSASKLDVLKAGYDMAITDIPEVREKVEAAEQAKREAAEEPDPKRKENAKKAASVNVKSSPSNPKPASEDEAMGAVWDKHHAAA